MKITTLFLDIGGVLGTNGWDHTERQLAAKQFGLDYEAMERRHKEVYPSHERGETTLNQYLSQVVFYTPRTFTVSQFKEFMREQSIPDLNMIEFMRSLKKDNKLSMMAMSNEGRDLADYRMQKFDLKSFMDAFFISCYVGIQKPDLRIYRTALDVCQLDPKEIIYIDDRDYLIAAAAEVGIAGIVHKSLDSTKQQLAAHGIGL
ncbi:MAG: HAD family phosphatase [Chlamydiales bacterium]|nr:HAD family phosphatase [Chlamydiales bacterium]